MVLCTFRVVSQLSDWKRVHMCTENHVCVYSTRTQGYFRGPSPQDVALRGVMQALVRIQAYMLADIVVAIPAVDLAIEAVV